MTVYSSPEELQRIATTLTKYLRLPTSTGSVPGAVMEAVIAHVRGGDVKDTYDFVDVVHAASRVGWQVKSTKASTPITWKRAKIENKNSLVAASRQSAAGLQALGDAIVDFCNVHAHESLSLYSLQDIGFCRLIVHSDGTLTYYERLLATTSNPDIFNKSEFTWAWSVPKKTTKKEQLSALHGTHVPTGKKWWAWHGLGENQLHFSGEDAWWPAKGGQHRVDFKMPADPLTFSEVLKML